MINANGHKITMAGAKEELTKELNLIIISYLSKFPEEDDTEKFLARNNKKNPIKRLMAMCEEAGMNYEDSVNTVQSIARFDIEV